MSDIALQASIDFREAAGQVDAFVNNTKKKMSTILAEAKKAGGSLATSGQSAFNETGAKRTRAILAQVGDIQRVNFNSAVKYTQAINAMDERNAAANLRRIASAERERTAANNRLARSERNLAEATNRDIITQDSLRTRADAENIRRARQTEKERVAAVNRVASAQRTVAEAENKIITAQDNLRAAAHAENVRRTQAAAKLREADAARTASSLRTVADAENKQITASSAIRARAESEDKKFDQNAYTRMRNHAEQENREFNNRMARTRRAADEDNKLFNLGRDQRIRADADNQKFDQNAYTRMRNRAEQENREFNNRMVRVRAHADAENRSFDNYQRMRMRADADNRKFDANPSGARSSERANVRAIGSAENTALGVTNRIGRQLGDNPDLQARLVGQLDNALKAYTSTVRSHGAGSLEAARASVAWNRELQNVRSSVAENGGLLRTLNQNTGTLRDSISGLGSGMGNFSRILMNTSVVLASLSAAFGFREIAQSIMEFERFSNTLRTVSGTTAEYQRNLSFLFAEANRIGFNVNEVGNSFSRLAVAMSGAGFSGDQTRQTFTQLSEASRNFGLTSADTNGVVRALEQSMSKGKFMAEEVRLQMGDRLPIAMAALTRAVRIVDGSVSDINKRFEEGTLDVQRYAQEFIRQINQMSGGAETLARTQNTLAAAFGRFGTEFQLATNAFGEGGFTQAVIRMTDGVRELLQTARESGAITTMGEALAGAARHADVLAVALTALAGTFAVRALIGLAAVFVTMNPLVLASVAAVTALTAAYAAYGRNIPSRAASDFREATANLATATDRAKAGVETLNSTILRGGQALDGAASQTENMIAVNKALGDSYLEAARKAAEAELQRQEALKRTAEAEQQAQTNAYTRRIISQPGISDFEANSRRRLAVLDNASERASAAGNPNARQFLEQTTVLLQVREIIAQTTRMETSFDDARVALTALFRGQETPAFVRDLLRAFAELAEDRSLRQMREQIVSGQTAMQGLTESIALLRASVTDEAVFTLRVRQIFEDNLPGAGEPGLTPPRAPNAPIPTPYNPSLISPDRRNDSALRLIRTQYAQAGIPTMTPSQGGGVGGNLSLPALQADLARRAQMPGNEGKAAVELQREVNRLLRETPDAANGARNAVEEYMRDLRLSAEASESATGAEKAHADALKRLRDAAVNSRNAVATATQEAEVAEQVNRRLTNQRTAAIRVMNRESDVTNTVAAAYARSNAAGREAEITTQAQIRALETAKVGTPQYTQAVLELTEALRKKAEADANATASRSIDTMNDEIAIMRLEGTLISANTNLRTEELAVARALQAARGSSPEILAQVEATTRQTAQLRTQNEQLTNSWNDLSSIGTQAFDKIGTAITTAFANGSLKALSFKNIAKAVFSEVIQAALKMAVINPILNAAFGGTRGTLGGAISSFGGAGGLAAVTGASSGITGSVAQISGGAAGVYDAGSMSGAMNSAGQTMALRQIGSYGNLGNAFTNSGGANTGLGFVDSALNYQLMAPNLAANTTATSSALGAMGPGVYGPAAPSSVLAAGGSNGLTLAGGIGGAAGIAGGAYGIYSGVKKGGVGGAVGVAGGAASMVGGASILGVLGPAMAALGPYALVAAAVLAIASALLPGEKPSGMGQLARTNLNTGAESFEGLGGKRFSQGNRDASSKAVDSIVDLAKEVGDKLGGARIGGNVAVGTTNTQLYLEVNGQKAQFGNDEAGSKALAETAARMVFNEFRGQNTAQGDYRGIVAGSSSLENLSENLQWYEDVYKKITKMGSAASAFGEQMEALKKPFDDAVGRAASLGLATEKITEMRDKEVAALQKERDGRVEDLIASARLRSIVAGVSGGDNSAAIESFALKGDVRAAENEVREFEKSLTDLGVTAAEVAEAVANLTAAQQIEIAQKTTARALERQTRLNNVIDVVENRSAQINPVGNVKALSEIAIRQISNQYQNEMLALKKELQELGVSAEETARQIATLNAAQGAEYWTNLANSMKSLDTGVTSRIQRTQARPELAALTDFNLQAEGEIRSLALALAALGLSAEIVSQKIGETQQALDAERVLLQRAFERSEQKRGFALTDVRFDLDTRAAAAGMAGLTPEAIEVARASYEAAKEVFDLRASLEDLGISSGDVAEQISRLQVVQVAEAAQRARDIEQRKKDLLVASGGQIRAYIDAQKATTSPGGPNPAEALAEAQSQFSKDLTLAQGGDQDALGRITGTADRLMAAGREQYASGAQFQSIRQMILSSLEGLPATRSYDQMILEELRKLGGGITVNVTLEVIRVISETLSALPQEQQNQLVQTQSVIRTVEERLGRILTPGELASLVDGEVLVREIRQTMGRDLSAIERASLVAADTVLRTIQQELKRDLTAAERAGLLSNSTVVLAVEQSLNRSLTATERAALVASGSVLQLVDQTLNRTLSLGERNLLVSSAVVSRAVEQVLGRDLTAAERAGILVAGNVIRSVEQTLGRTLTAAERALVLESGSVSRAVTQTIATKETIEISRSMDDKLSKILNAIEVSMNEAVKILGMVNADTNNLWKAAAGVNQPGLRVNSSQWSHDNSSNIIKFAKGGIFDQSTLFPMSGGRTGMLGEAGPEAIIPLERDASGRLGLSSQSSAINLEPLIEEVRELRREVAQMRAESNSEEKQANQTLVRVAEATEKTATSTSAPAQRGVVGKRERAA